MKKIVLSVACALLTVGAAFSFDATVVSTKGKAEILKGADWQPLTSGATVSKGDVIQTGFKSEVILKIKETTVTMDALSRLTVEQLAEKETKDETRLFLDTGSLKSDVQRSENRRVGFTVRSPVATASVRGTILTVKQKFQATDVSTQRGRVVVKKVRNAQAQIATEEEDAAAEVPAEVEIAAEKHGSVAVVAGQASSVSESEAQASSTQASASQEAAAQTGATTTQAAVETVAQTTAATQAESPVVEMPTSAGVKTGTVVIKFLD